jgi:hypothetical protein
MGQLLNILYLHFQHLATKIHTEGSGTKTKGTRLERAIRDLQNIVTECVYLIIKPYISWWIYF